MVSSFSSVQFLQCNISRNDFVIIESKLLKLSNLKYNFTFFLCHSNEQYNLMDTIEKKNAISIDLEAENPTEIFDHEMKVEENIKV